MPDYSNSIYFILTLIEIFNKLFFSKDNYKIQITLFNIQDFEVAIKILARF